MNGRVLGDRQLVLDSPRQPRQGHVVGDWVRHLRMTVMKHVYSWHLGLGLNFASLDS
jgi:hypothetical protein